MDLGYAVLNGQSYEVKRAIFAIAAAGNTDVVAAVAGKKIRVLRIIGTTDSATAAGFKMRSATTDKTNEMFTITTGGMFDSGYVWNFVETVAGEALNIIVSGNDFNGILWYIEHAQ